MEEKRKADIVIEININHNYPTVPEKYAEYPTPFRSRNVVYRNFMRGAYTPDQAKVISRGVNQGLTGGQIIEISDPDITPDLMAGAIAVARLINESGSYATDDDMEDEGIWLR